ncbi:YdcF family protein [Acidiferrimicrobium sp. IK]|uniref:YdcF family protein n=1 Tax=Acidiferrimicrobium sp. IK TaxID=2871700 RepID=UPI0021CB156A|nr:YdcF family protein [Acidiferrimicrobium sp. IK]MCU4184337.1 YdcF family protein [Acidiferrimicrobium sp. IK]
MLGLVGAPIRVALRVVLLLLAAVIVYLTVTVFQVWHASRRDQARPASAIVVLGAAQYNGVPSPDLAARLDHALGLWRRRLATTIVVTGGKAPGDAFTEATAGANYLMAHGVPQASILGEVGGRDSWESLESAAAILRQRGDRSVLLVSDPFHDERISLMSSELGLEPYVSPTRTSPIKGSATIPYFAKESVEVAVGRIIGFRRLVSIEQRVG